jgi:hypothetical protein
MQEVLDDVQEADGRRATASERQAHNVRAAGPEPPPSGHLDQHSTAFEREAVVEFDIEHRGDTARTGAHVHDPPG